MDGVKEGSAVVSEGVRVGGLEEAAVVVDVALDEVGDAVAVVVREWARGTRRVGRVRRSGLMGSSMWCSSGCGGRWGCC